MGFRQGPSCCGAGRAQTLHTAGRDVFATARDTRPAMVCAGGTVGGEGSPRRATVTPDVR